MVNELKVTVLFLGYMRDVAGRAEQAFEISEPTVGALIDRMTGELGEELRRTLINTSTGKVNGSVVMALNGVDVEALDGLKTALKEGDSIAIFPPVAAG